MGPCAGGPGPAPLRESHPSPRTTPARVDEGAGFCLPCSPQYCTGFPAFSGGSYHPRCVWVPMTQPPFLGPGHGRSRATCNCPDVCPQATGSRLLRDRAACRPHGTAPGQNQSRVPGPRTLWREDGHPWLLPLPGPHDTSLAGAETPHSTPGQAPSEAGREPRWLHPCRLCHAAPAAEQPGPRLPGRQLLLSACVQRPRKAPKGREAEQGVPGARGGQGVRGSRGSLG